MRALLLLLLLLPLLLPLLLLLLLLCCCCRPHFSTALDAGCIFAGVVLSAASCLGLYGVPTHNKCCILAVLVITFVSTLAMFATGGVMVVGITPLYPDDIVTGCAQVCACAAVGACAGALRA